MRCGAARLLQRGTTRTLARMQLLRVDRTIVFATAFPLLLAMHSAAFYLLPFLVPLATALVVALVGIAAVALAAWHLAKVRNRRSLVAVALVAVTWLVWVLCPTRELGVLARFSVEQHEYAEAVAQTRGGGQPSCVTTHACQSDGHTPPYLVFPFPGFLNVWLGVVHVPEPNQAPLPERLKAFASASGCDPKPISPHYYVCSFY